MRGKDRVCGYVEEGRCWVRVWRKAADRGTIRCVDGESVEGGVPVSCCKVPED